MATIKRYSFTCPHCNKKLATSWGDAYYGNMQDAFACPHCGRMVVLSPEQRMQKMAERQSSKGSLVILAGSLLLSVAVVYWFSKNKVGPLTSGQWAAAVGGVLVGTAFLFGLIQSIRKAVTYDRLKAKGTVK
jgi:hypothetical protein